MTAPSVSERLRELAEDIEQMRATIPPEYDMDASLAQGQRFRNHWGKITRALATEIEAHAGRLRSDLDEDEDWSERSCEVADNLAPRKEPK